MIEAFPEDKLFNYSVGGMRPFAELVYEFLGMAVPALPASRKRMLLSDNGQVQESRSYFILSITKYITAARPMFISVRWE